MCLLELFNFKTEKKIEANLDPAKIEAKNQLKLCTMNLF